MTFTLRHLFMTSVLVLAILASALLAYSQVATKPQPVGPVVLTGNDIGFRMTARKGGTPVGQLVVRVDGEWKEVEFSYGVKLLTK